MSLDSFIPPKEVAIAAARSSEMRATTGVDTLKMDFFCDGSFKSRPPGAGVGVVANIWLPRSLTKQRMSKACFIPCRFPGDDNNNTTEAFALAERAHVALDHVSSIMNQPPAGCRPTDKIRVTFWSDSQGVLASLEDPKRFRSPSKMQHILDIIRLKTRELYDWGADVSVQFCWCPEECVEPHATADQISKIARMTGSGERSKALALFHGVRHKAILSALGRSRRVPPAIAPVVAGSAKLATIANGSRCTPQHPALARDPALDPIIRDPVLMNVLYRAAGSSRFFSIVGGMVECLPSYLRSSMQEAIHQQQELNKTYDCYAQTPFNGREPNHQPSSSSRCPNLFAIIEITAWRLPAGHRDKAFTAIKLQKEANAQLVQDEVEGQVYQFEGSDAGDMNHELEAFGEPEAPEDNMSLEESEFSEESAGIIGESEVVEEPAMVAQEHKLSDTEDLDEPMDLDEPLDLDRAEALDEHDIIDETDVPAEIIDTIQEPRALEEPEPIEEPRPNRMRAVWAWFERKIARL